MVPKSDESYLDFIGAEARHRKVRCSELHRSVKASIAEPRAVPSSIVCPSVWLPSRQAVTRVELVEATRDILRNVYERSVSLEDLSWRTLEELVAELLRSRGLEIHLTSKSHDGGRDIVAKGELVPGEPMTLAVEVKKKPVVGVDDVRSALHANRAFPALFIATSGRFSAGVVGEKRDGLNMLRLFLKDGIALRQWLDLYATGRGWKQTLTATDAMPSRRD